MSIEYLSEANSQIFGTGFSDSLSKDITETMTELMSKLSNFGAKANPLRKMDFGDFWNKKVGGVEKGDDGGGDADREEFDVNNTNTDKDINKRKDTDEEDAFDVNTINQNNDVNNMNDNNDVNNTNNESDITSPKIVGKGGDDGPKIVGK